LHSLIEAFLDVAIHVHPPDTPKAANFERRDSRVWTGEQGVGIRPPATEVFGELLRTQ
jgi:hypothetical protein